MAIDKLTAQALASGAITADAIASGTVTPARLGSGTANSSTYLRGDGTWGPLATASVTSGTFSTARLGSGTANSSTYLRGDGTWAAISGGNSASAYSLGTMYGYTSSGGITSVGYGASASGSYSFSTGYGAQAYGNYAISIGYYTTTYANSIAIGNNARSSYMHAIMLGYDSQGNGENSVAIGSYSQSYSGTVSVGYYARSGNSYQTVVGSNVDSTNSSVPNLLLGSNINSSATSGQVVVLNASGSTYNISSPGFYTKAITSGTTANVLYYDASSGKVTYGAAPSGTSGGGGTPPTSLSFLDVTYTETYASSSYVTPSSAPISSPTKRSAMIISAYGQTPSNFSVVNGPWTGAFTYQPFFALSQYTQPGLPTFYTDQSGMTYGFLNFNAIGDANNENMVGVAGISYGPGETVLGVKDTATLRSQANLYNGVSAVYMFLSWTDSHPNKSLYENIIVSPSFESGVYVKQGTYVIMGGPTVTYKLYGIPVELLSPSSTTNIFDMAPASQYGGIQIYVTGY